MASFSRITTRPLFLTPSAGMTSCVPLAGQLVRLLFGAYLIVVIVAHLAVIPDLFASALQPCEPGSCYGGQISAQTFQRLAENGISPETYALVSTALMLLIPIFAHLLATLVVIQRPTDWLPLFFVLTFAFCSTGASEVRYLVPARFPSLDPWIQYIDVPVFFGFVALALLFPDGRFVPRWSWILLIMPVFDLLTAYRPGWTETAPNWLAQIGIFWWDWSAFLLPVCLLYRWHVTTDALQLRQIKTLFLGQLPLMFANVFWAVVVYLQPGRIAQGGLEAMFVYLSWGLGVTFMLFALFVSVNLDDLFDLQVAFDRTLIYIFLTLMLLGSYLLLVGFISILLPRGNNAVPALLATAVVAIAFAPLRSGLQRWSHRFIFGERDEPYHFLRRFGSQIGQADSEEALTQSILASVQLGLRVPGVSLAIAGSPGLSGSIGKPIGANPEVATVQFGDQKIGALSVARRTPSESFSDQDRMLIHEIARQTGITVHSMLQSDALRQSREQIVNAREEERRRLRRDLHDGIGPSLAALTMQIEHARDLLEHEPARAGVLLDDATEQIRDSIGSIRTIVYDLRPPALDELGLVGAIKIYASRYDGALLIECALPVSLPQLPAALEVAAYRIVQEGLTNVSRHAGASHAWVRLWVGPGELLVVVQDNGMGFLHNSTSGVGLVSMRERTSELGGAFTIESSPHGVTLTAAFPLTRDNGHSQ